MRLRRLTPIDAVLAAAVAGIGAAVRIPGLSTPSYLVFDEPYYVNDALKYLDLQPGDEVSWVHPPLGKWLIAGGIELGGNDPFGWRLAVVVAGILAVALTYLVAARLLGRIGGAVAALFVAFDGLAIVHSRTGILDGLIAPFLLGAVLILLPIFDRPASDHFDDAAPDVPDGTVEGATKTEHRTKVPQLSLRLCLAGVMLGSAVAVKWSAAPVLVAALVLVVARLRPRRPTVVVSIVVGLIVVPLATYCAAYATYWTSHGADLRDFARLHRLMLDFHQTLTATHPSGSTASTWLYMGTPVPYVLEDDGSRVTKVLALGNPALWWPFLATLPWLVYRWWTDNKLALELVVVALVTLYLPWLVTFRQGFLFYMTPLVPFMAIGLTWVVSDLWATPRPWRWVAPVVPVAVIVVGLLYLPLWMGEPISHDYLDRLQFIEGWR